MFKGIAFHGTLNERTGYGVHASRFTEQLSKLIPVNINGEGDVHVSLLDVVTASHTTVRHPAPSILYTVWESTEYPAEFMDKLKLYDQLWVPSEAQKAWSIAQGIPEEFVKVVPEGVDPDVYYPVSIIDPPETFDFLIVGQWQRRKSTLEIVQAFLKAFPRNPKVRLYLSVDTLFPSDEYKSTEERLAGNGIFDERIIPVHFETREAYVRRLQTCNCYVQCSRSEGWGLPGIEAMASGAVSILENWGGSTEYSDGALLVNVPKLEKPEGIYGGWSVPGEWGSPDYDHLTTLMKEVYKKYPVHKEKALVTANKIRTKFSWEAAAKKAYAVLQELSQKSEQMLSAIAPMDAEKDILAYARKQGYEITGMKKRKAIFTVDCHADSQIKMDTLVETIKQIKGFGYPILVSSHLPLPPEVIELTDFYIYDKRDILSGDDKPVYWRQFPDGTRETTKASIPCHALAACMNIRNSVDFCLGKYDWIYHMSSDTEIDLGEWLAKVHASDKPMICLKWEGQENTVSGQITASTTDIADKTTPKLETWAEFAALYGEHRFCAEEKYYKDVVAYVGLENIEFITMDVANRFDQVDRNAWKDDMFECHFVDGPFLNIVGISDREYDVSYSNSVDGPNVYTLKQKPGMWSRPSAKFCRDWEIRADLGGVTKFQHKLSLAGQNVIISMGSKALGDTIAWIPYVEEFRKKHNCTVYCSTWWNTIMDYPEIRFITPGDAVENVYATYEVGCHDNQLDRNPIDWRIVPLQKVAADILGLDYEPIRPKLKYIKHKGGNGKEPKPYICFSEFSTMQNKMWNREGAWQKVVDHLNKLGYDCVSISVEPTQLEGVIKHNGQSVDQTLTDLSGASFYIGLNHGPSWLAYAMGIPVIMLTGVSEPFNDFPMFARIQTDDCRPGCFNNTAVPIERFWDWCVNKEKFICTREITESMVMKQIARIRKELPCQLPSKRKTANTKSALPAELKVKGRRGRKPRAKKGSLMPSNTQIGDQQGVMV